MGVEAWIDGCPGGQLSLRDRGLAYGDGLFETLAVRSGRPRLLERHLQRVGEGCRRLALDCDLDLLRQEILAFSAALGEGTAKLMLTRGEGQRGYRPPRQAACRILLPAPLAAYPQAHAREGVRLFPCSTRLAQQPLLAGLKHLNRLEQVLARAEWDTDDYAEGLMLDTHGHVIEGVFSNLLLVREGILRTPSLQCCGVAGVMRAEILQRAQQAGITTLEADIPLAELLDADEVMLCNSQYGIWPVRGLGEDRRWQVGSLTRKLQGLLADILDC